MELSTCTIAAGRMHTFSTLIQVTHFETVTNKMVSLFLFSCYGLNCSDLACLASQQTFYNHSNELFLLWHFSELCWISTFIYSRLKSYKPVPLTCCSTDHKGLIQHTKNINVIWETVSQHESNHLVIISVPFYKWMFFSPIHFYT